MMTGSAGFQTQTRRRYQGQASLSLGGGFLGDHDLKMGVEFSAGIRL
jgi:hypothetical protein